HQVAFGIGEREVHGPGSYWTDRYNAAVLLARHIRAGHRCEQASGESRAGGRSGMSTFITKLDGTGAGPRVAVKDLVDVEGVPTTAGCRAVERTAKPAERDAPCLAGFRAADA